MSAPEHIAAVQSRVFEEHTPETFNALALEIFRYQAAENKVYKRYLEHLGINVSAVNDHGDIPFLPIGFFKTQKVVTGNFNEDALFTSSGTTGMQASRHLIRDLDIYRESFSKGFKYAYGDPAGYRFLALLPSYLEREGSSLVFMVDSLLKQGGFSESGFFLDEFELLAGRLQELSAKKIKTMLIGVSFALLDFAKRFPIPLGEAVTVMETGGMKGRRREITRAELHQRLMQAFGINEVHTEYGMTELLSQAYACSDGKLVPPPWMKVFARDIQDPFTKLPPGENGALNIIDLANIHSCAFIETQDLGKTNPDGSFEVLGRTDHSDVRGCSLMFT